MTKSFLTILSHFDAFFYQDELDTMVSVCSCEEDQEIIYLEVPPLFFIIHFRSLATAIAAELGSPFEAPTFLLIKTNASELIFFNIACPSLRGQKTVGTESVAANGGKLQIL